MKDMALYFQKVLEVRRVGGVRTAPFAESKTAGSNFTYCFSIKTILCLSAYVGTFS